MKYKNIFINIFYILFYYKVKTMKKKTVEKSKSQLIRELDARGLTKKQIANELGIRYQFVYNVLKRRDDDALMREINELFED